MITLLLLGIIGLGMAFFATQNTSQVTIVIGTYTLYGVPLYLLAIGSLLLGVAFSWPISIIDTLAAIFALRGKDAAIHNANRTIESLKKDLHALEVENAHLKGEEHDHKEEEEHAVGPRPPLLHRLKHSLSS